MDGTVLPDRGKIKSVVAYLARIRPGKVKLFKLMYLADFTAKAQLGESITGEMYENFTMGPVPRTLWNEFRSLTQECAVVAQVDTGVLPEQQLSPRPGYQIQLTREEQDILDGVIERYGAMSGNALRDLTHKTLPYKATESGESIPYGLAGYLQYSKATIDDVKAVQASAPLMSRLREIIRAEDATL